jgi:hypothetical protein
MALQQARPGRMIETDRKLVETCPYEHRPVELHGCISAPMGSGCVKGAGGLGPVVGATAAGFSCWRGMPARSRGQGRAPNWTNDLAAGEDRRRIVDEKARTTVNDVAEMARMHPFGPQVGSA